MQDNVQYVRDVRGVETLATPIKTLETMQGDCDDQAVLLASLLESIGHPTRFVAMAQTALGPFVHVFTEMVSVRNNRKIPAGTTNALLPQNGGA